MPLKINCQKAAAPKFSKLKIIMLACMFSPLIMLAQDTFKQGSFTIKGHVKNYTDPTIDFTTTTFFDYITKSVGVKPNGSFEQSFPIQQRQNIFFYLNQEAIDFSISDKDTIYLEWDQDDFKNSFSIKGNNPSRTAEIKNHYKLNQTIKKSLNDLDDYFYENDDKLTPEKKFTLINEAYNKDIQAIFSSADSISLATNYLITALYFRYSDVLYSERLIPRYKLELQLDSMRTYPKFDMAGKFSNYANLNEYWFNNVPEYRDFIFTYLRFSNPFNAVIGSPLNLKPNPTQDEYNLATTYLPYNHIKDWFITKSIFQGFAHYSFTDVENVYQQFQNTCTTPYLKDSLQKFYAAILRLKPGNPAPEFSLKDEKGKTISLNSFKGKVVYIDFWGVTCGPCIYDIKNKVPDLHKKYKDKEVVFVNICVDAEEKEWKDALIKYKLGGVNLIAKGWTKNPVCEAYNINGIPHYVLIDKNGKMGNPNAAGPGELNLENHKNAIDELLQSKTN